MFDLLIVPVKGLIGENEDDEDFSSISSRDLSVASSLSEEQVMGQGQSKIFEVKSPILNEIVLTNEREEMEMGLDNDELTTDANKRNAMHSPIGTSSREDRVSQTTELAENNLLQRVIAAERDASEAKRVLEESIDMLEDESLARHQAEEAVECLEREIEWLEKKSSKDKSDWERRMNDSLHKMESTVMLLEKVQREKEEMEKHAEHSLDRIKELEQLLDSTFVEEKIKSAEEIAKRNAEEQAAIQVLSLQKQIKTMASKLEAAEARHIVTVSHEKGRSVEQSEEKQHALMVENEYLKIEIESLRQDVASSASAAERAKQNSKREIEVYASRASDYADQLKEYQNVCSEAERSAAEARSRIVLLEDAIERSNLQVAELRQRLSLSTIQSNDISVDRSINSNIEDVMRLMREAQDSAEARAAQLALVSKELSFCQDQLAISKRETIDIQRKAEDAQRMASSLEEEVKCLRDELHERDQKRKQYASFHRDAGSSLSKEIKKSFEADSNLERDTEKDQAHALAQQASLAAAVLTEKLAASNLEKSELSSCLEQARFELHKIKSENDVELRKRVDTLERELVVSQNRGQVNEMFRGEHDRVAKELIDTKVSLAETQEELIVLKRNLFKSQEKSMNFASKLTKLETKLYRRLSKVTLSPRRRRTSSTSQTLSHEDG